MGQSSDELRQEIDQRRHDAEQKINDLQHQVQGTAEDLKAQAQDTATEMRGQVQHTVEDTIQTVKENVDFEQFVQEKPLVSLGAALIGGFVLGGLLDSSGGGSSSGDYSGGGSSYSSRSSGVGSSIAGAYKSSGLEETVNNAAAALMGSLTEQIKQTMDRNVPGFSGKMEQAKRTDGSVMEKSRQVQP